MKKVFVLAMFSFLFTANQARQVQAGIPVTCINCSNFIQQMLDSLTMAEELAAVIKQYEQMVIQTEKQIFMAQSEMNRILTLPGEMVQKYTGHFTQLAGLLTDLNMYKGDLSALTDIFRQAYPDINSIFGVLDVSNPNAVQEDWRRRSEQTDKIAEQAFKLSASQLHNLSQNHAAMQEHVQNLLNKKNETEIRQASNALTGMMLNETRDLKSLMAMQLQHEADRNLKSQKDEQVLRAIREDLVKTRDLGFNPTTEKNPF